MKETTMQVIGLAGRKRSGKDTAALILEEEYGFKRLALANPLKECLSTFLGVPEPTDKESVVSFSVSQEGLMEMAHLLRLDSSGFMERFREQMSVWVAGASYGQNCRSSVSRPCVGVCYTCDSVYYHLPYRKLIQTVGTDICRALDEQVWIRRTMYEITMNKKYGGCNKFVVSDIRFDNEAEFIHNLLGSVWCVTSTRGEYDTHSSEKGVDKKYISCIIANNGTLEELRESVKRVYKQFSGGEK